MAFLRRNHLAIAGRLCAVAILLYAVGYHFEARAVLFLAVEVGPSAELNELSPVRSSSCDIL
jgi:hypothetical protein